MRKNKTLRARLKHKIIFLEDRRTSEIAEEEWQNILEVFAQVTHYADNSLAQLENMNFGNIITEEYFIFKIRFTDKVQKSMRISFSNRIFEIKRLINVEMQNKILKIIALEI